MPVKRYVREAISHIEDGLEKILPMITAGVGLHDKYRNR